MAENHHHGKKHHTTEEDTTHYPTHETFPFPTADHDLILPLPPASEILKTLKPSHPRLLLSDDALNEILHKAESDTTGLQKQLFAKIVQQAEDDLLAELPQYMADNVRLANKPTTRSPALKKMKNSLFSKVMTLSMAFRLTTDARFADKAIDMMKSAASFPDWFPFHFLTVAELSFSVSLGYDWLFNYMGEQDREQIADGLYRNALSMANGLYGDYVEAIDKGALPSALARSKQGNDVAEDEAEEKPRKGSDERNPWVTGMNNQNQVGNGGMLAAALALAERWPEDARLVVRGAVRSLPLAQAEYFPDGCYPEGPGYWGFGTTYAVASCALLESALGTDFGLHALHGFDKTALYRLHVEGPTGQCFNYADAVADQPVMPCFSWLAMHSGNEHLQLHAAIAMQNSLASDAARQKSKLREMDRFFALHPVWFRVPASEEARALLTGRTGVCNVDLSNSSCSLGSAYEGSGTGQLAVKLSPLCTRLRGRGVDIAFLRSSWFDPDAAWVALKGGYNTVHHSHLDLGSFVLELGGVRWAVDLGKDSYGLRKYNSHLAKSPRWQYLRPINKGHNCVTLGRESAEGGDRPGEGALQSLGVNAPITHFFSSFSSTSTSAATTSGSSSSSSSSYLPPRAHAILDLSQVYSWPYLRKKALKMEFSDENPRSMFRGVALVGGPAPWVLLRDEICVHGSVFKGNAKGKQKNVLETDEFSFPAVWRMHTEAQVELVDGGRAALLRQEGQTLRVELLAPTPAQARFVLGSARPSTVSEAEAEAAAEAAKHKRGEMKDEKPETEDPNIGITVLAVELEMSGQGAGHCNGLGTCAGGGALGCHTLVVAVAFTLLRAAAAAAWPSVPPVYDAPLRSWDAAEALSALG